MSHTFADFLAHLRSDLHGDLPGRVAQARMAPKPRGDGVFPDAPQPDTRQGGVLVLLYPQDGRLFTPLILRPTYRGVHSGQVGFPGGGREESDADLVVTALREAYEEVGIDPQQVEVLGQLTPLYVIASNYLVQPTVGWASERPLFHPDPYEVADLLEIPLADLLDENNRRIEVWQLRGHAVQVPFFAVQGQTIWGATAMMLSEFLALRTIQAILR